MSYKSVEAIRENYLDRVETELGETRRREDDQAIMWWAFDTEPGKESQVGFIKSDTPLWKNLEKLEIYPFKTRKGQYLIYDANYKIASGGVPLKQDAFIAPPGIPGYTGPPPPAAGSSREGIVHHIYMIMNFVAGFQIEACEMMMAIGEYSSQIDKDGKKLVEAQSGLGLKTAPKPPDYYNWPDEEKVLLNKLYKRTREADGYGMEVYIFERRASKLVKHFWLQMVLFGEGNVCAGDRKWPIPGEFIGLGVRMLRGLPWGEQRSSPFIYSGNWVDGVFLTSGVIKEIIEPTDTIAYPTYKVSWHNLSDPITLNPSDFAEYKVGDRVTILKDITVTKTHQSSEDDDVKANCEKSKWQIVPITFYGDQGKEE